MPRRTIDGSNYFLAIFARVSESGPSTISVNDPKSGKARLARGPRISLSPWISLSLSLSLSLSRHGSRCCYGSQYTVRFPDRMQTFQNSHFIFTISSAHETQFILFMELRNNSRFQSRRKVPRKHGIFTRTIFRIRPELWRWSGRFPSRPTPGLVWRISVSDATNPSALTARAGSSIAPPHSI